jgi:hypothetical protein
VRLSRASSGFVRQLHVLDQPASTGEAPDRALAWVEQTDHGLFDARDGGG